MVRTGELRGVAKALQVVPAPLRSGRAAGGTPDPGGSFASRPDATFRGRALERLSQGLVLLGSEERGTAWILVAPVGKTGLTTLVVARDQGTDPLVAQADEGSGIFGGPALSDEPQGVEAASSSWCGGLLVASFEFLNSEVRSELDSSRHTGSIHPASV